MVWKINTTGTQVTKKSPRQRLIVLVDGICQYGYPMEPSEYFINRFELESHSLKSTASCALISRSNTGETSDFTYDTVA